MEEQPSKLSEAFRLFLQGQGYGMWFKITVLYFLEIIFQSSFRGFDNSRYLLWSILIMIDIVSWVLVICANIQHTITHFIKRGLCDLELWNFKLSSIRYFLSSHVFNFLYFSILFAPLKLLNYSGRTHYLKVNASKSRQDLDGMLWELRPYAFIMLCKCLFCSSENPKPKT